jgi:hypothetical protein
MKFVYYLIKTIQHKIKYYNDNKLIKREQSAMDCHSLFTLKYSLSEKELVYRKIFNPDLKCFILSDKFLICERRLLKAFMPK